jgi:hypothetical protein
MKPIIPVKFLVPIGLLLLSLSIVLRQFAHLPNFVNGFLGGLAIGILIISLIYKLRSHNAVQ